ncbi:MAG: AMP-binding protein, partial [Acidimicrobiales bacterium]
MNRIEHAAKGDGRITFVTGPEPLSMTWGELHERAKAVAAALQQRGVSHGDRVSLLGPTTPELVTALQAVWLTGATPVVLPLPMRLSSIEEFTATTKARVLAAESVAVLIDNDLAPFVAVEPGDPPLYPLADLDPAVSGAGAEAFIRPDYDDDDLFVLQFTSGSTSEPKGVMLANHVVAATLDAIGEAAAVDVDDDVLVSWLPLSHDMGLVGFCILPMPTGLDLVLGA